MKLLLYEIHFKTVLKWYCQHQTTTLMSYGTKIEINQLKQRFL